MNQLKIGCVLMAAGASRRFGGNKLLSLYEGRPMIDYALQAVPDDRLSRVVVVTGYPEIREKACAHGYVVVQNNDPEEGVALTIRLGVAALAGMDAALFMVADQPRLQAESVAAEIEFYRKEPEKITAMGCRGRRGNPAIFPRRYFEALCSLPADSGGSLIITRHPEQLRLFEIKDEAQLFDVDYKADLTK